MSCSLQLLTKFCISFVRAAFFLNVHIHLSRRSTSMNWRGRLEHDLVLFNNMNSRTKIKYDSYLEREGRIFKNCSKPAKKCFINKCRFFISNAFKRRKQIKINICFSVTRTSSSRVIKPISSWPNSGERKQSCSWQATLTFLVNVLIWCIVALFITSWLIPKFTIPKFMFPKMLFNPFV